MVSLADETCVRINKQTMPLTSVEVQDLLAEVPNWRIIQGEGIPTLSRTFKFANFNNALGFTNRVGQEAEEQDHHPAILTEWGRVTVTWWTHAIHGLHRNDFIMAARTDSVYNTLPTE